MSKLPAKVKLNIEDITEFVREIVAFAKLSGKKRILMNDADIYLKKMAAIYAQMQLETWEAPLTQP